jgi:type II secretory pathway component GspD/PulD (secretin)
MCYANFNVPIRSGIRLHPLMLSPLTAALAASLMIAGCSTAPMQPPSSGHLRAESVVATNPGIPSPVASTVTLPRPKAAAKAESYSVSVRNIPVQDLLFALARDAKLNVDIHPGIEGIVTLNAIDQTLQQILTRIAKQVEMRWDIEGPNLMVTPDTPFLKIYKVDYVNIARTMKGTVSVETAVTTTGGTGKASSEMTAESKNHLMASIVANVTEMLRETDAFIPIGGQSAASSSQVTAAGSGAAQVTGQSSGSQKAVGQNITQTGNAPSVSGSGNQNVAGSSEANKTNFFYREMVSVIPNHETGVLSIRAKKKQHDRIQEFLDNVMVAAKRQVLIEATIAEVELSDNYTQGIEWSRIASGIAGALAGTGSGGTGIAISQAASGLFTLTGNTPPPAGEPSTAPSPYCRSTAT